MTDEEAISISKRAHAVASRLHYTREGAQEYAQDAIVKCLEHPEWKVDLRFRVLDAIREDYGRSGSGKYVARLNFERAKRNDPQAIHGSSFEQLRSKHESDPLESEIFRAMLSGLKPVERAVINLSYVWGFTNKEIADCFGVTEGAIHNRLKRTQEKLAKSLQQSVEARKPGASKELPKVPVIEASPSQVLEEIFKKEWERVEPKENKSMEREEPREMAFFDVACF